MATVELFNAITFGLISILSLRLVVERRRAITVWAAVSFVAFTLVAIFIPFTPATGPYSQAWKVGIDVLVALLAVFPWALYKMSRAATPGSRVITNRIADVLLALMVLPAVFIVDLSAFSELPVGWRTFYSGIFIGYLVVLTLISGIKLWAAGRAQPVMVTKRLNLLAAATLLLGIGLIGCLARVGSASPIDPPGFTEVITAIAAVGFLVALAAPRFLWVYWTSSTEAELQRAVADITTSPDVTESIAAILPPLAQACGGYRAAFANPRGTALATYGIEPGAVWETAQERGRIGTAVPGGHIVVWTSSLWPLIAREDPQTRLNTVAAILSLSLSQREAAEVAHRLMVQNLVERSLRAQAAELERANSELQQFVAIASHDLQAPMRNLIDYVEFLRADIGTDLSPEADEDLGFINTAATRARDLIEALLSYTRVGNAAISLKRDVRLAEVVESALETLTPMLDDIEPTIETSALPAVSGDATMLTQLFMNLIENSIKYRKPDEQLQLLIYSEPSEGGYQISIQDNGRGVPPEFHDRIFAMFMRLQPDSDVPGTGIGLAICQRIVERHGGRIWVDSSDDQGTTISFTLPGRHQVTLPRPATADLRGNQHLVT